MCLCLKSFVLLILISYGSLLTSQPWQRETIYNLTPRGGAEDLWMWMLNLYIATRYYLQGSQSFFCGGHQVQSIISEMKILSFTIPTLLALIVPISAVECKYTMPMGVSTASAKHKPDSVHLQLIWCHSVLSIQCSLV